MNKRVHEIAKERGVPSRAVLERLRAAGVEVKAASSSVDEALALRVLDGGAQDGGTDGASDVATPEPAPTERAAGETQSPAASAQATRSQATREEGPARVKDARGAPRPPTDAAGSLPQPQAQTPRPQPQGEAGRQYKRPTRDSLQGERAP